MRILLIILIGFMGVSARSQDPVALRSDSIPLSIVCGDTTLLPIIGDTLITKKPLVLRFSNNSSTTDSGTVRSHLELSINYQTDDVYNGRKGNRVIPLVTPGVSYIFKNGFQTDLSVGYDIHDPSPQVNQYTLDVSYNFSPGDGNYTSSLTASRFFYSDQSESTTGDQKGSFEYDNSYDFGFIEPGIYLAWTYGAGKDYGSTFSLQHEFDFKNGKLNVTPNVSMNAGTQNYYDSYYHHRKYKIKGKDKKPAYEHVLIYGDVLNAGKFQILDYELTAPINYSFGRLALSMIPTYSMPVNPADILVTTTYKGSIVRTEMKKESLSNTFYLQVGFTYDFK